MIIYLAVAAMATADTSALQGEWARGDGKARVRMAPCGPDFCAINTWIKPGVRDEKVDDKLVMTLSHGGAMRWTGKAYDPQRKLTYRITITATARSMTTTGCVLGGLICKHMDWTRLD
ncbi:DUF2147 domain-containing protein [Asticcacaulis solisilvae]|uniref:DUF2147 domain-containing protein n=1 Tax=Asticcacaulis solisilvae TaxID=1217274 RepID=UPI003FD6FAAD